MKKDLRAAKAKEKAKGQKGRGKKNRGSNKPRAKPKTIKRKSK